MAKPTTVPTWATDANVTSGPQTGLTTKLAPAAGYLAQGAIAKKSAPARYMNWLFNLLCTWASYLDNLHNEVQFLNKAYTWTGLHAFTNAGTTNFSGSIYSNNAISALNDINAAGNISASVGNVIAGGSFNYQTPISRVRYRPLRGEQDTTAGGWTTDANGCISTGTNQGGYHIPLDVPHGNTLTQVLVRVDPGVGGAAAPMQIALFRLSPSAGTATLIGVAQNATLASGAVQDLTINAATGGAVPLPLVIDTSNFQYEIQIFASDTAAGSRDVVRLLSVTTTIPGPAGGN